MSGVSTTNSSRKSITRFKHDDKQETIIGGVDGNSGMSTLALYNYNGDEMIVCTGPAINLWEFTIKECEETINKLITVAKKECNIPKRKPLTSLGLCLSGCEYEKSNKELQRNLLRNFPLISKNYHICSDLFGVLCTLKLSYGIVVKAELGTSSLLVNPDGSVYRSGCWGPILGDEGSTYWVSVNAIKIVLKEQENVQPPPNGVKSEYVWQAIQQYFNIYERTELLPYIYKNSSKMKIAGLYSRIINGVIMRDELCEWLLNEAGHCLGKLITCLIPNVGKDQLLKGIDVYCTGCMWDNWEYLKSGFVNELEKTVDLKRLNLIKVDVTAAPGAAQLAAQAIHYPVQIKCDSTIIPLYQYDILKR